VQILYGPGGVGKSELSIAFANLSIEDFSFIWSISCGTNEEELVGYQSLAKRLGISLNEKETLSSLKNKVHRKLEQNRAKPWLLLLDNLQTSPELPNAPSLPERGGSILITSYRALNIQSLPPADVVATEVLPLESEEALKFLEDVTEKPFEDCKKLLNHVGCYPLLLGQVASYIRHTGIEVEEYLENLEQAGAVSEAQENASRTPKIVLEAAFNMTLQQLFPSAKKWLFLCSKLNAALIPVSYLKAWLQSESIAEEQAAIIAALEEHALLRYNAQEEVFSLHLEFQRILRSLAARDIGDEVAHLLVKMRNEWNFENTSNWGETMKKATIWASHAEPLVEAAGQMSLEDLDRASLLDGLGRWESANAHYGKELTYHAEALKIRRAALGENHPSVASSLNSIGICYRSQRNDAEALKVHGEALKIRRAVLGENHPSVASSLNNIGNCYNSQGNDVEALKMYGEALKIYRAALGENHPHIATSLINIGNCYYFQGNYAEALKVYGEALKIRRAALGENHPDVAMSLSDIGCCYNSQGNYAEALKVYGEALKIRRAALGENHPDVAMSLSNIGCCYNSQGNYAEALKMHGEALKISRAALGENHPNVATSLSNIGCCYDSQGNYAEALKVHEEALKIQRAALGENHPSVATTLRNIKRCQARLDKPQQKTKLQKPPKEEKCTIS
jgi:tetratricopeptide (TPR) repeat protein